MGITEYDYHVVIGVLRDLNDLAEGATTAELAEALYERIRGSYEPQAEGVFESYDADNAAEDARTKAKIERGNILATSEPETT